jgi:nicotinamidase-related amidase
MIIDPQNDFTNPKGSLFVNGAVEDMSRLAAFISKNKTKFYDIHTTLDSHHKLQVFHPMFWRDKDGKEPNPFTRITEDDITKGIWNTRIPSMRERALNYVKTLNAGNRYQLIIWPEHCLIGSWGTQVNDEVFKALMEWESATTGMVDFVTKGSNIGTEHYSAVRAEVIDPADPTTQLNQGLIDISQDSDVVLVAGEALDYCVYNTIKDIASAFGLENTKKIKILRDCTSSIDPSATAKIEDEFSKMGIQFVDTSWFDK